MAAKIKKKTTTTKRVVTRVVRPAAATNGSGGGGAENQPDPFQIVAEWFQKHLAFRIGVAELPIVTLLAVVLFCRLALYTHETYLHKYIAAMEFTPERMEREETYPRVECDIDDLTALDPRPLILQPNQTALDATENVLLHGASLFPQTLSTKTSSNLRSYILKRSRSLSPSEKVDVIMNDYRTSFTLSATEDPSVATALMEIANNQRLSQTLENLMGPDPTLMEFQVIIARQGANPQYFHADSPPRSSAISFAYTFGPLYTFLTPLQHTTPDMGPTAVCPGSHRCYYVPACYGFGTDIDNNTTEQVGFQAIDPAKGYWEAGTGLLYSSSTQHRGTGNSQGPDRVVLILSFASRPDHVARPSLYSRFPPLDSVYAIRWHQMGLSLSDLRDPYGKMSPSLTRWTGLWGTTSFNKLSWNSFRFDLFRAGNNHQYLFRGEDLQKDKDKMKGLMGTLSRMIFLPVESAEGFTDTEYHGMRLVERMQTVCLILAVLMGSFYFLLVAQTNKSWLPWSLARVVAFVTILYGLVQSYQSKIDESDWAKDIVNGKIAAGPYEFEPNMSISKAYSDNLPTPTIKDVLIDSLPSQLASQKYILDYMPGNRRWKAAAGGMAEYFLPYESFREALVEYVISLTRTEAGHTFFKRNDIGDFVELPNSDLRKATCEVMLQQLVDPQRRLGHAFDEYHCQAALGLCSSRPQVITSLMPGISGTQTKSSCTRKCTPLTKCGSSRYKIPPRKQFSPCRSGDETLLWKVDDVVQLQMDRMGKVPSRKWINAKIIAGNSDGTFNVEALGIDTHRKRGVPANRLRVPWKSASEPYGLAWRKYSSPTKRYLGAECFQTLNAPEQSTGSIVLNERNGTISTREFEVSNSLKAVEIEFYLQEYGSQSGKLSLLLGNETLDFQSFDPNLAEPEWSGLIDNVEGTIEVLSETRNHVKLVVPSTWIERDKLFFGVQVSEGLSVKVYNLQVNAVTASTYTSSSKKTAVHQWDPEPMAPLKTEDPMVVRAYTVPDDTALLEIDFDLLELGESAGLLTVLLVDVRIDLGLFDPQSVREEWSGYFYDTHATINGTSLTTDHVQLVVPSSWLKDNVLLFGVEAEEGLSCKLYNIQVTAVSASGAMHLIRYRPAQV